MKRVIALLLAASLTPVVGLAQEWKAYPYPEAGFAIQFPAPPKVEKSTFRTSAGVSLPMTRYAVWQDPIVFTLDVVDFSATNAEATSTIAEAEKSFGTSGKATVAIDARINGLMGRTERQWRGRQSSVIAIFFVNKHLYTLVGQSLPPNAIEKSGDAVRFQESLQFIGANGGAGSGGFGGFGGPGAGRFRGGPNPQAQRACAGKAVGNAVQLDTPAGPVPAT